VWLRQQVAHDGFVLIAEVGGTFAGFVAGWVAEEANLTETTDSNRVGYVSDICVMPAYRGQHIAADLLVAIERHLTESGISRMRLASLAANASAQTAYRRAGYAPYEIIFERCIGGRSGVSPLNQFDSLGPLPIGDARCRSAICREVIESLPDWFGIPASNQAFVAAAEELPMLACFAPDGEVLGFVSMKARTPIATELYVLGVKRTWHRRGVGRRLIEAVAKLAALDGIRFLTVKTLAPSKPDPQLRRDTPLLRGHGVSADRGISDAVEPGEPVPADAAASGASASSALA
jgi:ribosomal protein S18 acetylase RimI-like enzyme